MINVVIWLFWLLVLGSLTGCVAYYKEQFLTRFFGTLLGLYILMSVSIFVLNHING